MEVQSSPNYMLYRFSHVFRLKRGTSHHLRSRVSGQRLRLFRSLIDGAVSSSTTQAMPPRVSHFIISSDLSHRYRRPYLTVLIFYEHLITLKYEEVFLRDRKRSAGTWILLSNRYLLIAYALVRVAPVSPQVSEPTDH